MGSVAVPAPEFKSKRLTKRSKSIGEAGLADETTTARPSPSIEKATKKSMAVVATDLMQKRKTGSLNQTMTLEHLSSSSSSLLHHTPPQKLRTIYLHTRCEPLKIKKYQLYSFGEMKRQGCRLLLQASALL
jgi:hypothetical protein